MPTFSPSLLTDLQALKPLPKRHYAWPLQPTFKPEILSTPDGSALFQEYARLTGSVPLSLDYFKKETASQILEVAAKVPKCGIGISTSPYLNMTKLPADDWGLACNQAISKLVADVSIMSSFLDSERQRLSHSLIVSCVMIDIEHWHTTTASGFYEKQDPASLRAKYDLVYDLVSKEFPQASIVHYDRGGVSWSNGNPDSEFFDSDYYDLSEKGNYASCSLYSPIELYAMQETFRRTATKTAMPVVPYIALGYNHIREPKPLGVPVKMDYKTPYPTANSYHLGWMLNFNSTYTRKYGPFDRMPFGVFYPAPFSPESDTQGSTWADHFLAYCRGAHLA